MDFKLDLVTGDLDLKGNKISLITTLEDLVRQRLKIKFSINKGEWKFNKDFGLPYIQEGDARQILYKTDPAFVESVYKEAILEEELVTSIIKYESNWDKTLMIYSANITLGITNGTLIDISL